MTKLDKNKPVDLKIGDIYEDCKYHPCIAIKVLDTRYDKGVWGISLIDGTVGNCCRLNCGLRKLTMLEGIELYKNGPDKEIRESMEEDAIEAEDSKRALARLWWKSEHHKALHERLNAPEPE